MFQCAVFCTAVRGEKPVPTPRPPLPPFSLETAAAKVRAAEDAWNTRDPERVALAYTEDSQWRNRTEFFQGRAAIVAFLTRKWEREREYRLCKELWGTRENRMAVRFVYESQEASTGAAQAPGQWWRSFGNELWEFDADGYMRVRQASINDLRIADVERRFHWPLGPRPEGHPGLTEMGF